MVRLPRSVWIQLAILAVVTVIAVGVMAFGFANVPALLGIGRYNVTLDLPSSGGLYQSSVVTYRGSEIGRVTSIDVTPDGVRAVLKLESSTKVPSDVSAAVHSRSAVGEQFVELSPTGGDDDKSRPLRDGDVIPVGRTQIPPDIGGLLDATNRALHAIPQDNLRTVVDEADKAVAGLGPELSRIVDGSTSLAREAAKNQDSITQLIDQSPPVLNSQVQTADSIATWADRMASITGQLKAQDAAFADLLNIGGSALDEGRALFDRVAPALPVLLANLVSLGEIAVTYRSDIEQLLVLFPQGTAVMSAIVAANANTKQDYKGVYLDFNLNLNLPPPGSSGRPPTSSIPNGPPESCTAACRRTRRSMSVACAIFRARSTPPSGRRPSRSAKATRSTSPSTTASTGRAIRTRRSPVRVCRSMRRVRIPGWRRLRAQVPRSRLAHRRHRTLPPRRRRPSHSRPTIRRPAATSGPMATATRRPISRILGIRPGSRC